jgi:copper resistance protein C
MAVSAHRLGSALLLASLGAYGPAIHAHAGLVSSEPGRRAVLTVPPEEIRLCFNENIEPKFSTVTLSQGDDPIESLGEVQTDPEVPACLVVPLQSPLGNGSYTVKYRVLSVDGHVVDYGYGFKLKAP